MRISKWFAGILATLAIWFGITQVTPDRTITITGDAPTTNTDGSTLTDLTHILIWESKNDGPYAIVNTMAFTDEGAQFTWETTDRVDGKWCYKASALNAIGLVSDFSNVTCKVLDFHTPSAPTNVTAR